MEDENNEKECVQPVQRADQTEAEIAVSEIMYSDVDNDDKIVINVGGVRHETARSTLASKPNTRLSHIAHRHSRLQRHEYFFDRHPGVFNTVIDYYRSGELHVPLDVCGAVVKRELDFWGINEGEIESCCWISYSSYIDNQKNLADFNENIVIEDYAIDASLRGWKRWQHRIWMILDHPRSSRLAMAYAVTSFLFVLTSIAGFCLETLPSLKKTKQDVSNETFIVNCFGKMENKTAFEMTSSNRFLEVIDYMCTAFFTIELIVRIVFAPEKMKFFRSPMNVIDILALLPLYVQIILIWTDPNNCLRSHRAVLETIFILRIIRIFRIFHLVKHYKALKILVHAIRASVQELLMLAIFLFIAMLVFSTLIFYAERKGPMMESDTFPTIPIGFWWSIITMTTVGYGDISPKSALGYTIGTICALCGVLLLALTIPVVSNNFALFYMHARTREQIIARDKKDAPNGMEEANGKTGSYKNRMLESTRALLVGCDSNSDESGMLMVAKTQDDATSAVDSKTTPNNVVSASCETAM